MTAVLFEHVLNDFFPSLVFEVDVDIRRLVAFFGDEALKEQMTSCGIKFRDVQAIADRGIRRRATALTKNLQTPCLTHDVVHGQKIGLILFSVTSRNSFLSWLLTFDGMWF